MKRNRVHKITKSFEIVPEKRYNKFNKTEDYTGHYMVIQEGVANLLTQDTMDLLREANNGK